MTRVLFLAYHFPPLGGPGTQRSLALVRDLPALGFDPLVVTGPGTTIGRWDPLDPTMLDVTAEAEVVRVAGTPGDEGGRLERWLDRPSEFTRWWVRGAIEAARPHLDRVGLIYAAMGPYETAFAAERLAAESGLPWIADMRDPWALDEMRVYPSEVHRRRDRQRMREVLATAHAIVMNTPEAAAALRAAFPELGLKLVASVPNGFDASDFPERDTPVNGDGRFRIVHTGSLHSALGLRHASSLGVRRLLGGAEPVDILARSHVHLVAALRKLRERSPALERRVELHLAGVLSDEDRKLAEGVRTVFHGYVDHPETVALIRSADLLFLPMHDLPPGRRARLVPGKTYEYIGSGRPILAAVPDGDARDILAEVPHAYVCRPTDVDAMAAAVENEVRYVARLGRRADAVPSISSDYERGRLAEALAGVLERVVPASPREVARARPPLKVIG